MTSHEGYQGYRAERLEKAGMAHLVRNDGQRQHLTPCRRALPNEKLDAPRDAPICLACQYEFRGMARVQPHTGSRPAGKSQPVWVRNKHRKGGKGRRRS